MSGQYILICIRYSNVLDVLTQVGEAGKYASRIPSWQCSELQLAKEDLVSGLEGRMGASAIPLGRAPSSDTVTDRGAHR